LELLYGRNAVIEALRAGRRRIHRLLVANGSDPPESLLNEAARRGIGIGRVERQRLDERASHHQGVIAEADPFRYTHLDDLLEDKTAPLLLALDSLQDPQNFGSLLRTAQACDVDGVLIAERRAVGVTPAVSNASAGAVEHLPVARVTNLVRALEALKSRGVWIYGLEVEAATEYWRVDWTTAAAIVVGSEGSGLGRLVRETCDVLVSIPMAKGAVQSLNASVAGSLVVYEAYRQRLRS
jgi:23S rRNA (guanosine2251-2'-O)-methyltransferase